MSTAIEFPGFPATISANANGAAVTATLPAPGAGFLLYLDGFIIAANAPGATVASNVNITGLGGGGGTLTFIVNNAPGTGLYATYTFPNGWPASAANTAISVATAASLTNTTTIVVFGHSIPV